MDENLLFYGDNLEVLKFHVKDESVDLVYLDPPFNSNATYNVLFHDKIGISSSAQIKAFEDRSRQHRLLRFARHGEEVPTAPDHHRFRTALREADRIPARR